MPNVLNEFAGDGVTRTFNFSMTGGYLSRDYVYFFTRPNDDLLNYTPYNDDDVTWLTDFSVRIANPIPVGTTFVILRSTTLDPLVDFQNTSRITEKNLDTATWQAVHIAAETSDTVGRIQVVATNAKEESSTAVTLAQAAADDAASSANSAQQAGAAAASALTASQVAQQEAIAAALSADQAVTTAAQAESTAIAANATAQAANASAATATTTANAATTAATNATTTANNAVAVANSANAKANAANASATAAVGTANSAAASAAAAVVTANEAKDLVDQAVAGAVVSFNGRAGIVTTQAGDYTKAQVGLGNVDNTADVDKPVSTAQSNAIGIKADKSYVDSQLNTKADKSYVDSQLNTKADKGLTNAALAQKADQSYVTSALSANATDDRNRANHTGKQTLETISNAGTSAGRNVQTSAYAPTGVMEVGAFGLGSKAPAVTPTINVFDTGFNIYTSSTAGAPNASGGAMISVGIGTGGATAAGSIFLTMDGRMLFRTGDYTSAPTREVYHTGNIAGFLGIGQTFTDVTPLRATGVTYTNTTGKPIWVTVLRESVYNTTPLMLYINGGIADWDGVVVGTYTQYSCVQGIVPVGGLYSVTSDKPLTAWRELR